MSGQLTGMLHVLEPFLAKATSNKLSAYSLTPAIRTLTAIATTPEQLHDYLAQATAVADGLAHGINRETTWKTGIPEATITATSRDDVAQALSNLERTERERQTQRRTGRRAG